LQLFNELILPGDIFGFLALALISYTSVFMLVRKRLLKLTRNLDLLRKVHMYAATLGGLFLVLHVAYFITWPLTTGVVLGYVAAAIAGVVWVTGTAFLERFRDSLFYHGSLSLAAVSLMTIHAASSALNFPVLLAYAIVLSSTLVVVYKAFKHGEKTLKASGLVRA
jgi:hypothetical protein